MSILLLYTEKFSGRILHLIFKKSVQSETTLTNLIAMKTFLIATLCLLLIHPVFSQNQQIEIKTSDGVKLHITKKGEGMPVLYLHGGPGSGSYWFELFMGDYLEQHFQMIYLDQRGVGRSGSPDDGNFSLDRFLQDFEEIRVELGIEKWITMGHSFGGILQTAYANRHPEAISGMIMINASLYMQGSFNESWCLKASEILEIPEPFPCRDETLPLFDRWNTLIEELNENDLMWKMGFDNRENLDKMNSTYRDISNWNSDFGNAFQDFEDFQIDFRPLTNSLNMPVLFYYGTRDWMAGPEHYREIGFPNMLLWQGDTAHMPFLENKGDLIDAIESFMHKFGF